MIREQYLTDVLRQFEKYKELAERATAQISDEQLFEVLGEESNSIAIVMKHMAGNMRSRWTDFLTSDGEKPDRQRDLEFEREPADSRESLLERWEDGWRTALDAISSLGWKDLERTVTIRGERHSVVEAINRQLSHYAYHVGQIVLLARHLAGANWRSLSIPKGRSADYEVAKQGARYEVRRD
jgi:uncharacterized damage-inducible protein DinB